MAVCAAFALITGRAKDFYLPGIWMYLLLSFSPPMRWAFDIATVVMATASWSRFLVQNYLYDTDQEGLLAAARVAMGWPIFLITSSAIYVAVRVAIRALPRAHTGGYAGGG